MSRQILRYFARSVSRSIVVLKCESFSSYETDYWQKVLVAEDVTVIRTMNFAFGSMNIMRSVLPSIDTPIDTMTDFEKVDRVR